MTAVVFNPYKKKNGEWMLFINSTTKASIGLCGGYAPYGKGMTEGKRNTANNGLKAFKENAKPFEGDLNLHKEGSYVCGGYTLCVTDIAEIGGMQVESDGAYLVRDNLILKCGQWFEV